MEVISLSWDEARIQVETLGRQSVQVPSAAAYGIASFPQGVRRPAEGQSGPGGIEISFIQDGETIAETRGGIAIVPRKITPAGEPHVTWTSKVGRVAYFLFTEVQE